MVQSRRDTPRNEPPADGEPRSSRPDSTPGPGLYFFPDEHVTEERARALLEDGSLEEKAWVVSHLLRFAQWDDIWTYVSRDEAREIFEHLELPETLRAAWARMLKVDAPVA